MNIGMLWFDGQGEKDVHPRVQAAARYYRDKYGRMPNVCFLHPSMMSDPKKTRVDGVDLRTSSSILRGHLWLGVDEGSD
jgi:hypothetical protein